MWKICNSKNIKQAINFISKYEYNYMNITSRYLSGKKIIKNKKDLLFIKEINSEIEGVVLLGKYGLIAPIINIKDESDFNLINLILHENISLHSIMGEKKEVEYFFDILKNNNYRENISIHYFTMTSFSLNGFNSNLNKLKIKKASYKDLHSLMKLQKLYEIEEVLINTNRYNYLVSLSKLNKTIKEQTVLYAKINSEIIAKANTNAKGLNFQQIGGVFVLNNHRNKGIGKKIIYDLIKKIFTEKKKPCLFVKKENIPAIQLYKSLGFKIVSDFKITYLI